VVAQGGHGTVVRALLGGAPLLCLPRGRDQFDNARRVTQRGAGLALPGTSSVRAIRRALARLLAETEWRANAARLGAAIAADQDQGRRAALLLEQSVRPGP
jgi:UDP:flavonoid glycosyltransferase YjiC (YdhE family)